MNFIFWFTLLMPLATFANNRVGNGGDIIQCPTKSQVLDLYESSEPLVKITESDEYLFAEKILVGLKLHAPDLEKQYQNRLKSMRDEIELKSEIKLINIKDSKNLFKPKDKKCKLLQIVVRKNLKSTHGKRFVIDQELWNALDAQNKAALLIHEIVYEHFFKLGMNDSVAAREFNRFMFEERFTKITKKEFWAFIASLKVPIYQ